MSDKRANLILAIGEEIEALSARGVKLPAATRILWQPYMGEYLAEKFAARHASDNFFDENQPRDERGRFGEGGGEGGGVLKSSGGSSATRGEVNALKDATKKWMDEGGYTTPPNSSDVIKAGMKYGGMSRSDAIRVYAVYREHSGENSSQVSDAELLTALDLALDKLNAVENV